MPRKNDSEFTVIYTLSITRWFVLHDGDHLHDIEFIHFPGNSGKAMAEGCFRAITKWLGRDDVYINDKPYHHAYGGHFEKYGFGIVVDGEERDASYEVSLTRHYGYL